MPVAKRKQQAMAMLQAGRVVEAKEIFAGLSRDARRDPDVWHLLAACHSILGDYVQCETFARKAIALLPSFSGAWSNLGSSLLCQGKLTEAETALREAIKHAPADALAHSNLGNVYREMKNLDLAESCYREALRYQPNFADALTNLGLVVQDRGALKEAAALHQRALSLDAQHADAHYNLGYTLMLLGEEKSAIPYLERVTILRPGDSRGWVSLGSACARIHDQRRAVACYEHAVAVDSGNAETLQSLGVCYLAVGQRAKAAGALARALELKPGDQETHFWLAAAGHGKAPDKMTADAVAKLFDGYAGNFDEHLVRELQYRTPGLINKAMRLALGDRARSLSLLDLGCGTGLLGVEVSEVAEYLAGVDLSQKMIARANARGIYHNLAVQDISDYLESTSKRFDAVLSADVFIYLGDLDRVFAATSARLRSGGLFVFSVEAHDGDGPYELRASGRYAHSLTYLHELSARYRFNEVSVDRVILRLEKGVPMEGHITVLSSSRP
jgi:predicted TPR repeat methyltransferase